MLNWLLQQLLGVPAQPTHRYPHTVPHTHTLPHPHTPTHPHIPPHPHTPPQSAFAAEPTRESNRDSLRFSPELFEARTDVIAELSNRGFEWLSHYSSVDPIHDVYGIEVSGIRDSEDAAAILDILCEMFPDWKPGRLRYKDYGSEPGFKAKVHRDRDRPYESWETA